jgi:hypothetical protein
VQRDHAEKPRRARWEGNSADRNGMIHEISRRRCRALANATRVSASRSSSPTQSRGQNATPVRSDARPVRYDDFVGGAERRSHNLVAQRSWREAVRDHTPHCPENRSGPAPSAGAPPARYAPS